MEVEKYSETIATHGDIATHTARNKGATHTIISRLVCEQRDHMRKEMLIRKNQCSEIQNITSGEQKWGRCLAETMFGTKSRDSLCLWQDNAIAVKEKMNAGECSKEIHDQILPLRQASRIWDRGRN